MENWRGLLQTVLWIKHTFMAGGAGYLRVGAFVHSIAAEESNPQVCSMAEFYLLLALGYLFIIFLTMYKRGSRGGLPDLCSSMLYF